MEEKLMSHDTLMKKIDDLVVEFGYAETARLLGISAPFMYCVFKRRRTVGKKILKALGLEKRSFYAKASQDK